VATSLEAHRLSLEERVRQLTAEVTALTQENAHVKELEADQARTWRFVREVRIDNPIHH
jgi:hypothetical protein